MLGLSYGIFKRRCVKIKMVYQILTVGAGFTCPNQQSLIHKANCFLEEETSPLPAK